MANPLRLVRVDVRDKFAPSSPTVLAVFAKVIEATSEEPRPGMQHLTIVAPLNDPAVAQCVERRILRRTMSDGTWREYRIADVIESTGPQGAQIEVSAVDPVLDLGSAEVIRDTLASGIVEFEVGLVQQTVTEIVDSEVIGRLPAEYAHFQRGTIEPTAKYDLRFTAATPLGVLEQLALAGADPVTHLPAEYRVRQTAGAFFIDVLAEIGSTQPIADVRSQKNLKANRKSRSTGRMATVMLGFGADDGSGARTTIARAAWKLANPVGLVYEITDPEGGPSPVLEDDQLNGMYVVPNGPGSLVQITDSSAGNPATVTLASSSGIVAGEVYELRANASDKLMTELSSPSRAAGPPSGYGRVVGTITREDSFGARNLITNPWFRSWSNPANPPDGWSVSSGASGSTSRNTDPLYTEYGGFSWKVELPSVAGGVHTLRSPTFYPRPVNGASTFAVKARFFLAVFSGDCFIELRVERASSLLPPLVIKQWVPADYPVASSAPRLATGDYIDIGIEGIDLSAAGTSGLQLHLVFYSHPSLGNAPGTVTAYVDAVMLTQTPKVPPIWVEYSGSNPLWHAVNLALVNSRDPIVSYDADVLDLTRKDGTKFPYDALVGGAMLRLTDRDGTVNGALLRIMAMRSINWLEEGEASLTLATRQQLLADLLDRSSSATSVAVSGPGGGASTPPTSPGPAPGPAPTPTPTPSPNAGRLLKTIIANGPGEALVIEDMPAALTDLDTASEEGAFFVDFTGVTDVYLTGVVVDDDGGSGELRIQYLRPSDSTWRYLDGSAGPALPLNTAGKTIATSVTIESDARGPRWCKVVTINGDGAINPVIGHLALHGGTIVSQPGTIQPIAGLLADWDPTEGSGGTVADKWSSYDMSFVNSPTWESGPSIGFGSAGAFAWKLMRALSNDLQLLTSSAICYIKTGPSDILGDFSGVVGTANGGTPYFGARGVLSIDAAGHFAVEMHPTGLATPTVTLTGTTVIGTDEEHSVGWTHDGTTLKLFVDGVEEASAVCAACFPLDAGSVYFYLGASNTPTLQDQLDGHRIGRFLLYSGGLSAAQMASLHGVLKQTYAGLP